MTTLSLSILVFTGVLTLVSGCTNSHKSHDDVDDHHSSNEADSDHGHDNEDHHESDIGMPGKAESVDRRISVSMGDTMRFSPSDFEVFAGETIQFDITNDGKVAHEFVLGTNSEIQEHHALMQKFPGMEHDEPNSVSLETNTSGVVIWTFTKASTVDIACLKAGHFEAGMRGSIVVTEK